MAKILLVINPLRLKTNNKKNENTIEKTLINVHLLLKNKSYTDKIKSIEVINGPSIVVVVNKLVSIIL
jgi:hypothetical protein